MARRKMAEARKAAFLDAVRETGNLTLAAERARVSKSWAYAERERDPAFDAAVRSAVAAFGDALGKDGRRHPPAKWRWFEGAELVVRGCNARRAQIRRARLDEWTPRTEQRFLRCLERSCNARASYAEVGKSKSSAYAHRNRRPDFAQDWQQAIAEGHTRLDEGLLAGAIAFFERRAEPAGPPDGPALGPMDVEQAIRLLRAYDRRARDRERERRRDERAGGQPSGGR